MLDLDENFDSWEGSQPEVMDLSMLTAEQIYPLLITVLNKYW